MCPDFDHIYADYHINKSVCVSYLISNLTDGNNPLSVKKNCLEFNTNRTNK